MTIVGQIGVSGPLPIQPTFQVGREYTYVSNVQNFSASTSYARAIEETSRQTALVYDSAVGIAWLVPKLSLLLHLCQRNLTYYQDDELFLHPGLIPFAEPSCDGSRAAKEALFDKGDTVLRWYGTRQFDKILLRQILVNINTNVSDTSRIRELPEKTKLLGSELMNMIAGPGTANGLAEVTSKDASNSWFSLAQHVDAIFVCKDLGAAIQPALRDRAVDTARCACREIPEKRDFLAAHVWCLKLILQRRGIHIDQVLSEEGVKIDKHHYWLLTGQPFQACQCPCPQSQQGDYWAKEGRALQKISKQGLLGSKPILRTTGSPPPVTGAVVFGSSSIQSWLERAKSYRT